MELRGGLPCIRVTVAGEGVPPQELNLRVDTGSSRGLLLPEAAAEHLSLSFSGRETL